MPAGGYIAALEAPFAAPASARTALLVLAGANSGLVVVEFGISFDGVSASNVPVLVEMVSTTAAGAGTPVGTVQVTQVRGRITGGEAPTAGGRYTAEPTVLVRHRAWYVSPNGGILVMQFPLGREPETDDSGGAIKGYGIRITPPNAVNAMAYMEVEKNN